MIGRTDDQVSLFVLLGYDWERTNMAGRCADWAAKYKGNPDIYGHTPQPARLFNNTVNIDTGCVFGGELTALRYPEREIVSVPAHWTYAQSTRPIAFANPAPPLD